MIVKAKIKGTYGGIVCYPGAIFEIQEADFEPLWMVKEEDLIKESETKESEKETENA